MATSARRRLVFGAALISIAALCFVVWNAYETYRTQQRIFFPAREPIRISVRDAAIDALREVTIPAASGSVRGWYVPSTNRAVVILIHGSGGNRTSLLREARILVRGGFGVLSFDLPGHGESEGQIRWGDPERQAVRASIDFVSRQNDVDPTRIGGFGFSMGGYILIQVAATDPRIRALAVAAAPTDPVEQSRWQFQSLGPFSQIPAVLALRRSGMPTGELVARDIISKIAPRPLLMIGGTRDATVPEFMVRELFGAARPPKELWIVPRAQHGDYAEAAGVEYERRLTEFFQRGLLARSE